MPRAGMAAMFSLCARCTSRTSAEAGPAAAASSAAASNMGMARVRRFISRLLGIGRRIVSMKLAHAAVECAQKRQRPHCCGLGHALPQRPEARGISADALWARCCVSALTRFETRVALADHEDLATAANHLAVAVTGLRRLQGGQDLHDRPRLQNWVDTERSPRF